MNAVFEIKNSRAKVITEREADYVISIYRYLPGISLSNSHSRESIEKIKAVMTEISKKHEVAIILSYDESNEEVKEALANPNVKTHTYYDFLAQMTEHIARLIENNQHDPFRYC